MTFPAPTIPVGETREDVRHDSGGCIEVRIELVLRFDGLAKAAPLFRLDRISRHLVGKVAHLKGGLDGPRGDGPQGGSGLLEASSNEVGGLREHSRLFLRSGLGSRGGVGLLPLRLHPLEGLEDLRTN